MINRYIDFIIEQVIKDSQYVQYDYGWNIILIPYFYWFIFFALKYIILTLPIWLPLQIILNGIFDYYTKVKYKISRK